MTWRLCVCAVWMCAQMPLVCAQSRDADSSLAQQRAQVRAQQAALRERLAAVQQEIAAQDAQRRDVMQTLKASEHAISTLSRELNQLHREAQTLQADVSRLREETTLQHQRLDQRRHALAEQLRAQYVSGLSPWTVLLAGGDSQAIGRNLGYFGYVSRAQTDAVRGVQQVLADLERLRLSVQARQRELDTLTDAAQTREQALHVQRQAQQRALQKIEIALQARRTQADQLLRDVQGLESLVSKLETEIARQQAARAAQQRSDGSDGLNGLEGLQAKLPYPVPGSIHGRFGVERPEGGRWRGVVIRAVSGTPVRAVAPGRVVYANWLTGFGNLMIVDHGAQYLTVYAYNQSLLHAVGDRVARGETLARVGSTGGQVEPGLYFEIRHKGVPVNPQLWLQP